MTSKLSKKKPEGSGEDLTTLRNSIKHNPKDLIEKAQNSLPDLKMTEKEKIESGEYEWITITPKVGKSYKVLKKKKHEN
jgi:hypothetical protein